MLLVVVLAGCAAAVPSTVQAARREPVRPMALESGWVAATEPRIGARLILDAPALRAPATASTECPEGTYSQSIGVGRDQTTSVLTHCARPDGTPHGPATLIDARGQWWVTTVNSYREGALDGESWSFYPDGSPEGRMVYVGGEAHGPSYRWYATGEILGVENYRHSRRNGVWRQYYRSGYVRRECVYLVGMPLGCEKFADGDPNESATGPPIPLQFTSPPP